MTQGFTPGVKGLILSISLVSLDLETTPERVSYLTVSSAAALLLNM